MIAQLLNELSCYAPVIATLATVGILVATTVYAFFAAKQWRELHRQMNAMESSQRAWVGQATMSTEHEHTTPDGWFLSIPFINSGHTPALDAGITVHCGYSPSGPLEDVTQAVTPRQLEVSKTVILPGGTRWVTIELPPVAQQPDFKNGKSRVYVWGEITYRLVFGSARYTHFNAFRTGNRSVWSDADHHNEAT